MEIYNRRKLRETAPTLARSITTKCVCLTFFRRPVDQGSLAGVLDAVRIERVLEPGASGRRRDRRPVHGPGGHGSVLSRDLEERGRRLGWHVGARRSGGRVERDASWKLHGWWRRRWWRSDGIELRRWRRRWRRGREVLGRRRRRRDGEKLQRRRSGRTVLRAVRRKRRRQRRRYAVVRSVSGEHRGRQALETRPWRRPTGLRPDLVQFASATVTATVVDVATGVLDEMLSRVHVRHRVVRQETVVRPFAGHERLSPRPTQHMSHGLRIFQVDN